MKKSIERLKALFPEYELFLLLFFGMEFKNLLLQCFVSSPMGRSPYLFGSLVFLKGLIFSLPLLLLFCVPLLFMKKTKSRKAYMWTYNSIFTLLSFVDICYFRCFHVMPSLDILKVAEESVGAGHVNFEAVFATFSYFDILFFADFLLILALHLARKWEKRKKGEELSKKAPLKEPLFEESPSKEKTSLSNEALFSKKHRILSCVSLVLAVLLIFSVLPIANLMGFFKTAYKDIYLPAYNANTVGYFTPIGYHILDLLEVSGAIYREKHPENSESFPTNSPIVEQEIEEIREFYRYNNENIGENSYKGLLKNKNVVLIQVESMEDFVIGKKVGNEEITPNLNRFLAHSLYFSNIYDQVKSGNSCDCDLMINTSILPTTKLFFKHYQDKDLPSMPEILRTHGYETYYFNGSGSKTVWPYTKVYPNAFGYTEKGENQNFFMIDKEAKEDQIFKYTSDEATFRTVIEKLKEKHSSEHPFYSHVVLCSSHTPFYYDDLENVGKIPEKYKVFGKESPKLKDHKVIAYLNDLHYVDAQIGAFVENLKKEGLLENTVLVIYGDHTGIHKYFPEKAEKLAKTYKEYAFVNEKKYNSIPLIVYDGSENMKGEEIETYGGQVDIMPTLLSLLDVEKEEYRFAMGKNLLNTKRNYVVLANGTVLGEFKESEPQFRLVYRMYHIADLIVMTDFLNKEWNNEREEFK